MQLIIICKLLIKLFIYLFIYIISVTLSLTTLIISNHLQYTIDTNCFNMNKRLLRALTEFNKLCVVPDFWGQIFFSLGTFGFLFVGLIFLDRFEIDNQT